jgi:hypothetical protein
VIGRRERVRFDTSTFRNTDSDVILARFDFDPEALLSGDASVGYRMMTTAVPDAPDYRGPVAAVGLTYAGLPSTRFDVQMSRDVSYSYEDSYPYYVSTAVLISITQRITGPLDLVARGRRAWLDYQPIEGWADPRTDQTDRYGGGVGVRLGDYSRVGFEVEWVERRSVEPLRRYMGTRYFGSVDYGF